MAMILDAPVPPDALTMFVREIPTPAELRLTALFGAPRPVLDNKIDWAEVNKTNRTARYRAFDGRIHVSRRDTGQEKMVPLAPLGSSLSMGEYERLQLEFARNGGTNKAALANAVYNDAEQLTREVQYRLEQAWGDVLVDGKLTISENGFDSEADYGIPANHIVSAATAWTTTATASALTNLIAWMDVYNATNGFNPGFILTSQRVHRLIQQNKEIIDAVGGAAAQRTRVKAEEVADLLSSEGLPTLLPPYDTQVDIDGTSTRVIPDDRLIFLPPTIGNLGYTAMGISATALELVNSNAVDMSFQEAPGIVGVVIKDGPPFREWTFVDAVGQPVLTNSKQLLVADVL